MKQQFLELIDQIDTIESKFHSLPSSHGLAMPSVVEIRDVPEFQIWIQKIQFELQEIVDTTSDTFALNTLESAKTTYNGWNDKTDFNELKGKLLAMKTHIDKYYSARWDYVEEKVSKSSKVFISHASKDKEYVSKLVELLDDMGLNQTQVFCSSLPGYDIPVSADIFSYLREQFHEYNLHVFFVHSKNYYKRAVCLNEMGAAWVLRNEYTSFLLPGFGFEEMTGVVDSKSIAIKLDNDEVEVKDKLNQLYETMVSEFGLTKKTNIIWEQKRDRFIREVKEIVVPDEDAQQEQEDDIELLDNGLLVKKSEVEAGKKIYYCQSCYQNTGKLFTIVRGTLVMDRFCPNCKMHYSTR